MKVQLRERQSNFD